MLGVSRVCAGQVAGGLCSWLLIVGSEGVDILVMNIEVVKPLKMPTVKFFRCFSVEYVPLGINSGLTR